MRPIAQRTDTELMRAAQAGGREAFAQLVRRYEAALLRVASSRLGRRDWAEETVQETLMAAYRSRMSFLLDRNFRTWLWTILLNQCRRHYKRRSQRADVLSLSSPWGVDSPGEPAIEPASPHPSPLAVLIAKERAELVDSLMLRLTEPQADALRLRFFAGLKFHEIAETMDCSLLTAKNRVRWGLARMSQFLTDSAEAARRDNERGNTT